MARKLREQHPGAVYHAINRGDYRKDMYRSDNDRRLFLETLGQACQKTDWQGRKVNTLFFKRSAYKSSSRPCTALHGVNAWAREF